MVNKNIPRPLTPDQKKKLDDEKYHPATLFPGLPMNSKAPEEPPIIYNIVPGGKPGPNEHIPFSLLEKSTISHLDDILNTDDPMVIKETIKIIVHFINESPDLRNALNDNKIVRSKFTKVFGKLLKARDYVHISQLMFLEPPIFDLLNKYSKEANLKDCAIDYLLGYFNLCYSVTRKNVSYYCQQISKIIRYLEINSNYPRFKELSIAAEHLELKEGGDPTVYKILRVFFDRLFKKDKGESPTSTTIMPP
jgi:hypothetical protein